MKPVTEQEKTLFTTAVNGFFFILKTVTVCLLVLFGVLVVSQSSVSPISTRLLSIYAVEYAMYKVKPYRHFFPKPYRINLQEEQR